VKLAIISQEMRIRYGRRGLALRGLVSVMNPASVNVLLTRSWML
jgi:hypothetical protein